jgi:hypothetical protein
LVHRSRGLPNNATIIEVVPDATIVTDGGQQRDAQTRQYSFDLAPDRALVEMTCEPP